MANPRPVLPTPATQSLGHATLCCGAAIRKVEHLATLGPVKAADRDRLLALVVGLRVRRES